MQHELTLTVRALAAGHVLYHGPCKEVMGFFQGLGFDLPERKGIPDFLQEVTGRKDQKVRAPMLPVLPVQRPSFSSTDMG